MSVIIGFIADRDGVVASDGRMFDSALLENDRVINPARILSESFDKTFALFGGRVIGTFSGLMSFAGKTIAEHAAEILGEFVTQVSDLQRVVSEFSDKMVNRLSLIGPEEVIFPCRKLDVLFVGGKNLRRSDMRIVSIRFSPDGGVILPEIETVVADRSNGYFVRGEDNAAHAAGRTLAQNRAKNRDLHFLEKLAIQAVNAGIRASGVHPHGVDRACGGKVYSRRTWYK